jgi:RNA polymerase sigma-70 factor (ECF subfamily)
LLRPQAEVLVMHGPEPEATSATLLGRLRSQPPDADAWQEFVRRYRPRIYTFCLAFPLQPADAEDVTQAVLLKLVVKLQAFRYDQDQSFRGWLKVVTRNVLLDFLAERGRAQGSGDSAIVRLLENVEAREGLVRQLEAGYDQELLEAALRHVRDRVPARQWEAFRLTALAGLSGADAAAQLGMLVATVYTAKCKVQRLVRAEIRRLEGDPAEDGKA